MKNRLVLCDFDETLFCKDSFRNFFISYIGIFKFSLFVILVIPLLILEMLKILPMSFVKRIAIYFFLKGKNEKVTDNFGREYIHVIDSNLNVKLYTLLKQKQSDGFEITIVSGSLSFWLKPWCDKEGFNLISSFVKIKNGVHTGKLIGKDCNGIEKAVRIKQVYNLSKFHKIIAFGNSRGDYAMFDLAHEKYFRYGF